MVTKHKPNAGRRKGRKMPFLSLVTLTFDHDIQTRPSDGSNVFRVNLAQICSVVPEIFHTQTNKSSAVAEMGDRSHNRHRPKSGWGLCLFFLGGAGSPSNTISPRLRPTSVPSGIVVHTAVLPH